MDPREIAADSANRRAQKRFAQREAPEALRREAIRSSKKKGRLQKKMEIDTTFPLINVSGGHMTRTPESLALQRAYQGGDFQAMSHEEKMAKLQRGLRLNLPAPGPIPAEDLTLRGIAINSALANFNAEDRHDFFSRQDVSDALDRIYEDHNYGATEADLAALQSLGLASNEPWQS